MAVSECMLVPIDPVLLSAIILNYKRPDLAVQSAQSVLSSADQVGITVEVAIVDNSAADTSGALRRGLTDTRVQVLDNDRNMGFSHGVNQGVRASSGEFLLLLNSDAFMNPASLQRAMSFLATHPRTGIWAPRLIDEHGHPQMSCARLPSPLSVISEYLTRFHLSWYRDLSSWTEPQTVGMAIAACWVLMRSTWDSVGPLDERYFFTGEDADYCIRLRRTGFLVTYDPRASVTHIGSASQSWGWEADPHLHRGRRIYLRKHHGLIGWAIGSLAIYVGLGLRRFKARISRAR